MPDAVFEDPRLTAVYDSLDPDRSDLEFYADIVREVGARRVLDVGCGTGTFAIMLTAMGVQVTGVDPDRASLDVARGKSGAERVTWIEGDATTLPPMQVELATMTANVAQVFLTLAELEATGLVLTSDSTLRSHTRAEVERALLTRGFVVEGVRDAVDRPGRELVFVARTAE